MDETPPTPPPPQPQSGSQPPLPPDTPPPMGASPFPSGPISAEEKQMAMWCHLASFAGYFIPVGNVIGPLILWLNKRETMPFVDREGKESLNFQISVTIYALISGVMTFFCIGFFMLLAVIIFDIIFVVLACIEASKGNSYKYPLCIRFVT